METNTSVSSVKLFLYHCFLDTEKVAQLTSIRPENTKTNSVKEVKQLREDLCFPETVCRTCYNPCAELIRLKLYDLTEGWTYPVEEVRKKKGRYINAKAPKWDERKNPNNREDMLYKMHVEYKKHVHNRQLDGFQKTTNVTSVLQELLSIGTQNLQNITNTLTGSKQMRNSTNKTKKNQSLVLALLGNTKVGKSVLLSQLFARGAQCPDCPEVLVSEEKTTKAHPIKSSRSVADFYQGFVVVENAPTSYRMQRSNTQLKESGRGSLSETTNRIPVHGFFMFDSKYKALQDARVALVSLSFQMSTTISGFSPSLLGPLLGRPKQVVEAAVLDKVAEDLDSLTLEELFDQLLVVPSLDIKKSKAFDKFQVYTIVVDNLDTVSLGQQMTVKNLLRESGKKLPSYIVLCFSLRFELSVDDPLSMMDKPSKTNISRRSKLKMKVKEDFYQDLEAQGIVNVEMPLTEEQNLSLLTRFIHRRLASFLSRSSFKGENEPGFVKKMSSKEMRAIQRALLVKSCGVIGNLQFIDQTLASNPQLDSTMDGTAVDTILKQLKEQSQTSSCDYQSCIEQVFFSMDEACFSAIFFPLFIAEFNIPLEIDLFFEFMKKQLKLETTKEAQQLFMSKLSLLETFLEVRKGEKFTVLETICFPSSEVLQFVKQEFLTRFKKTEADYEAQFQSSLRLFVGICLDYLSVRGYSEYCFKRIMRHLSELQHVKGFHTLLLSNYFFLVNAVKTTDLLEDIERYYLPLLQSSRTVGSLAYKKVCLLMSVLRKAGSALLNDHRQLESQFMARVTEEEKHAFENLIMDMKDYNARLSRKTAVARWIPKTASLELADVPVVEAFKILSQHYQEAGPQGQDVRQQEANQREQGTRRQDRNIAARLKSLTISPNVYNEQLLKVIVTEKASLLILCYSSYLTFYAIKSNLPGAEIQAKVYNQPLSPLYKLRIEKEKLLDVCYHRRCLIYLTTRRAVLRRFRSGEFSNETCISKLQGKDTLIYEKIDSQDDYYQLDAKVGVIYNNRSPLVFISDHESLSCFHYHKSLKTFSLYHKILFAEVDNDKLSEASIVSEGDKYKMTKVSVFYQYSQRMMLCGTITGQVFALSVSDDRSTHGETKQDKKKGKKGEKKTKKAKAEKSLMVKHLFSVEEQTGGVDTIAKIHARKCGDCMEILIATENGFIGLYEVRQKKKQKKKQKAGKVEFHALRVKVIGEIRSAKVSKHRGSIIDSEQFNCVSLGESKVVTRKDHSIEVRDLDSLHIYEIPAHSEGISFITSLNSSGSKFVSVTEDLMVRVWDLDLLEIKGIRNSIHMSVSTRSLTVGSVSDEEDDEDVGTQYDDLDFFLNTNDDIDETTKVLEEQEEDEGKEEADSEGVAENDDVDDNFFFLNTHSDIDNLTLDGNLSIRDKDKDRQKNKDSVFRFNKAQISCTSDFRHDEWISCIEVNESKDIVAIGYKDGRIALFTLSKVFFNSSANRESPETLGDINLIASRTLHSEILSLQIAESGIYLVCYTGNAVNVYAISRSGFKKNGQINHMLLVWSQLKDHRRHRQVSFSVCSNYIRFWGDSKREKITILNMQQMRKLRPKELIEELETIDWEEPPEPMQLELDGNRVVSVAQYKKNRKTVVNWIPFTMDGSENIITSFSKKHNIAVIGQGNYVHFLLLQV